MSGSAGPFARLRLWLSARASQAESHRLLWQAAFVGIGAACAIVAFREALAWIEWLLYGRREGLVAAASALPPLWRVLIPTLGGVLAGFFLSWARRIRTDVASDYMEALSLRDGAVSTRLSLVRSAASLASVASGGSIGREGPMVQLAALAGELWSRARGLSAPQRRMLVACGGAAGIAAAYNAPIAGALFIAEIVLRTLAVDSLAPLLVAAVAASLVSHGMFGSAPIYDLPALSFHADAAVLLHALLGLAVGLAAPAFMVLLDGAKRSFGRLPDLMPLRLGLGGLGVGLISLALPQVWGNGFSVVNGMLAQHWAWQFLLVLLVFKLLATALTIGSGAIGGAFTPSLFVGAALGSLFGVAIQAGGFQGDALPFVVTGMAAFLAATLHAPLTAIVIVIEMTGNLALLAPAMLASVLALSLSRLLRAESIYASSLKPLPRRSFARRTVTEVLRTDPPAAALDAPLTQFRALYLEKRWQHIYVTDDAAHFVGAVSIHTLGSRLLDAQPAERLPPALVQRDYPRLSLEMPLAEALGQFTRHTGERLPVLDRAGRLAGYVTKTDLLLLLGEEISAA